MAGLVERSRPLLFCVEDHRFPASAKHDPISSVFKVDALNLIRTPPHRDESSLVDEVGKVGASHSWSCACHRRQVDIVAHPLIAAVHFENLKTLLIFGERHDDLAVKAPRAQKRRIEDVRAVGGRHDDDAL